MVDGIFVNEGIPEGNTNSEASRKTIAHFFPVLILASVAAVYWNSLTVPFIYDDKSWVLNNPSIQELLPAWPPGARWFSELTFSLNFRFHQFRPEGYHLFNTFIHAGAALAFYGVLRRFLGGVFAPAASNEKVSVFALFAALLWALHPLHTESVTYIVQRHESLMGFLGLLMCYFFSRAVFSNRSALWLGCAVFAYLLGLGCKEVIVAVPAVILLFDLLFLAPLDKSGLRKRTGFYLALILVTFTVLPSIIHIFTAAGENVSAGFGLKSITPLEYASLQPGVLLHYMRLAFWPQPLNIHYYVSGQSFLNPLLSAGVIAAVIAYGFLQLKRNRIAGFLLLSFFILLMPTSSLIPLKDAAAEHRMYLSLTMYASGLTALIFGVYLRNSPEKISTMHKVLIAAACLYLLTLAFLTVSRNRDYQDEAVLWEKSLALEPDNARAHNSVALIYMERGKVVEGIRHLETAIRLMPNYASPHLNLGLCYEALGRLDAAEVKYKESLKLHPGSAEALANLGNIYVKKGEFEKAERFYVRALESKSQDALTLMNYAGLSYLRNDKRKAENLYRKALALNSHDADIWNSLGFVLAESGRVREGLKYFRKALELNPEHSKAIKNLNRFSNLGGAAA